MGNGSTVSPSLPYWSYPAAEQNRITVSFLGNNFFWECGDVYILDALCRLCYVVCSKQLGS